MTLTPKAREALVSNVIRRAIQLSGARQLDAIRDQSLTELDYQLEDCVSALERAGVQLGDADGGDGAEPDYCPSCGAHADAEHRPGCPRDPNAANPECRWCHHRAQGVALSPAEQAEPSCGSLGHGRAFRGTDDPWSAQLTGQPKLAPVYDPRNP